MTLPARLIVADPGLRGVMGHHFGYSLAVTTAARARGIAPVLLPSAGFNGALPEGIACRPSFTAVYQSAGQGGALRRLLFGAGSLLPGPLAACIAPPLRALRRAARRPGPDGFAAELAASLIALGGNRADMVLLHTVSASNLAGLGEALAPGCLGVLAIVLRRTPDDMDRDDAGPQSMAAILAGLAARFGQGVRLFADTMPLCRMWSRLIGLEVTEAPPPVLTLPVREPLPGTPPHLVFAGGARAEKGYAALPPLVRSLGGAVRFTIHSGPIGAGDDPIVQRAHRRLRALAGPGLTLVEAPLATDEYLALIRAADLLLLPYDPASYGPRSSGILAEARAMGVPAVVPKGCWMEDAVGPDPRLAFDSAYVFPDAVRRALGDLPTLLGAYGGAAPEWRAAHAPATLLSRLVGETP